MRIASCLDEIQRIQCSFIWGDLEDGRKISFCELYASDDSKEIWGSWVEMIGGYKRCLSYEAWVGALEQ